MNKELKKKSLKELEKMFIQKSKEILIYSDIRLLYLDSEEDNIKYSVDNFHFTAYCNRLKKEVTSIYVSEARVSIQISDCKEKQDMYRTISNIEQRYLKHFSYNYNNLFKSVK